MPPRPSIENLVSFLQSCSNVKYLSIALRLHSYSCNYGLHSHVFLGNRVVSLLVETGKMCLAQKVFDRLPYRDASSWSDLINGYIEHAGQRHALCLYDKMQQECPKSSGVTLVGLIKSCVSLNDIEQGCKLHAAIDQTGILNVDMFVGSALVSMYVSFGLLERAQELCSTLPVQNVVAWNVLIAGYMQHNRSNEAFRCYEHMHCKGVLPNAVTFACILKACSSLGAMDEVSDIHAEIVRSGLLKENLFLGNVLVNMYAKCGILTKAQEVFHSLPIRDIVTWTALVSGYVKNGQYEEALTCFELMQSIGPAPNAITFACILRACSSIEAFEKGMEIHAEVVRMGLIKTDPYIGSVLIDMYSKWGLLPRALEVFKMLSIHNVVTWTALISGYMQHNRSEEALKCFEQMQKQGVAPNAATYICSLKACGRIRNAEQGSQLHEEIVKKGLLEKDFSIGSALVDMYAKCGMLIKAKEVFDMLPDRNVVTWSALITGYMQGDSNEEALQWLEYMDLEGSSPNFVTYAGSLKACGNMQATEKGIELHVEIARKGLLTKEILLGSVLIDMYAKCGYLAKAQEVFDMLLIRNLVIWNTLINVYTQAEHCEVALYHFEGMKREAMLPSATTYACILKVCGGTGATDRGIKMHTMIGDELVKTDLFVGSALINMYSKCGLIHRAQEVFDVIPFRNVVHWGALITGYAQQGEMEVALFLFDRMMKEGNEPDCATFLIILMGCSHSGFIDKGQTCFEVMSTGYGIPPTLNHHICVVDLLGRAGQLDMAVAMMKKTPCHPNDTMWLSMLSACRKWGQLELGRGVFHEAMQLNEKEASAYVCMSNIYADNGACQHLYQSAEAIGF